jgi:hypothetical protein
MLKINVNTGLEKYILIDNIIKINDIEIHGSVAFNSAPPYTGIESLAQLGAMHVRWLHDFTKHAALLKINNIDIKDCGQLNGNYSITGILTAKSGRAFTYSLQSSINGDIKIEGSIIFALIDYDLKFKKEILETHYKKLFSCLTKK